ncbi:KilA domain-containing protein [Rodentibacter pneumotropicus]|uniref:KilA domain-containing protein n=1 Tax=Rodentibacter pneumotropicus TaxID=758 RepID=A0A3S4U934_9PAST|nr:KilA domain-containing protein [Rodentibacter pneumotropicus]
MTTQLSILNNSIRTFENLFSLTDLHKASGAENKHKPTFFLRLDQTKDLIAEIEVNSELQICNSVKVIHGGPNSGTYACEELVLAYATWISPKFHLIVLRAFLAMHRNEPKQLALAEPEKKFTFEFTEHELQLLPWIWFIALRGTETCRMIYPAMEAIGSTYSGAIYGQAYEYKHTIREVHKLLKRLTADFQYDYESNWRVLKHLNNYNPKSNNYQVI